MMIGPEPRTTPLLTPKCVPVTHVPPVQLLGAVVLVLDSVIHASWNPAT